MSIPPGNIPPRDRWHRRYWIYINRPYPGFGCLWMVLMFGFFWWFLSVLFPPIGIWNWWK